jgi:hypothetical protein
MFVEALPEGTRRNLGGAVKTSWNDVKRFFNAKPGLCSRRFSAP